MRIRGAREKGCCPRDVSLWRWHQVLCANLFRYIDSLLARIKSLETRLEAAGAPEIIVSELHQPNQDPQLISGDICETRESTAEPDSVTVTP